MRKRFGGVLIISGILLLLDPELKFMSVIEDLENIVPVYWPFLLVILGLKLQGQSGKKTHR